MIDKNTLKKQKQQPTTSNNNKKIPKKGKTLFPETDSQKLLHYSIKNAKFSRKNITKHTKSVSFRGNLKREREMNRNCL